MTENLFDVLGVLMAFVTVMLIFSIAVTSLVQATQGLFRWRARNLQNALAKIIEDESNDAEPWKTAIRLLNNADGSLLASNFDADSRMARFFGPQLSWMSPEELERELSKSNDRFDLEQKARIAARFRRAQDTMRKIFLRRMRIGTLFWAIVVAFYYQLSTPQLLNEFSENPAAQQAAIDTGNAVLGEGASDAGKDEGPVSYFRLAPWRDQWAFYYVADEESEGLAVIADVRWDNIVGMLITVLLLCMGAPFWFDMLKTVASLRDTLEKHKTPMNADGETGDVAAVPSNFVDDRIRLLLERLHATGNPVVRASLQKEINDLRLVRAETG